jgi:hypothetical protein
MSEPISRRGLVQAAAGAMAAGALPETPVRASERQRPLQIEPAPDGWRVTNLLTGERITLSPAAPLFIFADGRAGGPEAGAGNWRRANDCWIGEWELHGASPALIRTTLMPDPRSGVLRRTADIRLADGASALAPPSPAGKGAGGLGPSRLLCEVILDRVTMPEPPVHRGGVQSYPVFGRSFFMGVEYPVATTRLDGAQVVLAHAPGRRLAPGETYRSRSAVYGAAPAGRARDAFEAYVAGLRPAPRGVHFNYNSWWTSPVPYKESDILALVERFRRELFVPYGVAPDTFCIDMGWAKNTTLWRIDPALFPNGFAAIERACAGIRSRLGLWISPSGLYGQALDLAWAKRAGYETDTKACLGGARYRKALQASLSDMVARCGVRHVKLDGYVFQCDSTEHGHEPGPLSVEPIAEGLLEVIAAIRKIAPDIWIEPTCFGFDPSPWWLAYCNSVIGEYGDDAPNGRTPCPVYRESYTTGRDFYNLQGARDILAPIAAQEVLGIVHQTAEPLANDAVVTVLRGHQFLPLYVNPAFMTPRRWEFLAALMQWTRSNADLLAHTRPILPASWRGQGTAPDEARSMPREPYGYAHWDGERGLVCLRNPWIEPARMTLDLARDIGIRSASSLAASGLAASSLAAVALYPDRRMLSPRTAPEGTLAIDLAPYETLVFALTPARGRRTAAPSPPACPSVSVRARVSRFEPSDTGPDLGPDYTRLLTGAAAYLRAHLAGEIAPAGPEPHELLLLLESPEPVPEPLCSLKFDDAPAPCRIVSSEMGWRATGAPAPEHWLWIVAPLPIGSKRVRLEATVTGAARQIAGWVVRKQVVPWRPRRRPDGSTLPQPEERYLASARLFAPASMSDRLPAERGPSPVERIPGVYLDALEPLSAQQGWGTLQRNRSVWEKPIVVGGRSFRRGLGTHAVSRLVYALDGRYRRFRAWAGADQATAPTITMEVRVDGRSVWASGPLTRESPAHRIDLDVTGAQRLELLVGDGGNGIASDHADWADAMLLTEAP